MLQKLDRLVIDMHQHVVDFTQLRPIVLARWSLLMVALSVATIVVDGSLKGKSPPTGWLVLLTLGLLLLSATTATERVYHITTKFDKYARLLNLGYLALDVAASWLFEPNWGNAIKILQSVCLLGYFTYCACRPPTPRPPRRKLAGSLT